MRVVAIVAFLLGFVLAGHATRSHAGEVAAAVVAEPADGGMDDRERFGRLMRTRAVTPVHRRPHVRSRLIARIYPGAVLRLAERGRGRGCPGAWMERAGGGYICSRKLRATSEQAPAPAERDRPDILGGVEIYRVVEGGARLYRKKRHIWQGRTQIFLIRGAVLSVVETFRRFGGEFHRTREGWFAEAANTEKLPPPTPSLAVESSLGGEPPDAIAIEPRVPVVARCERERSEPLRALERWSVVELDEDAENDAPQGMLAVAGGGLVSDEHVARYREPALPEDLAEDERWIAVDLSEQLLHAREGRRTLRVVPCSTGREGNTRPGEYRVEWKRRLQTMRPRGGHLRVEDVQYVMYYERRRSIAIHAAHWHDEFGHPVSHGCVNLPLADARWLYEWSAPRSLPEDSESFPTPGNPGTRVVVFE
jgi:hypothetical protein